MESAEKESINGKKPYTKLKKEQGVRLLLFHCISARLCVTRHAQIVRIIAVENDSLPVFEHGDLRRKLIDEIALVSVHRACTEHIESDSEAKCPIAEFKLIFGGKSAIII